MDTLKFIEKANKIYGEIFDYSKVNYINTETKVCIICTKHGEFWQTPHVFLKGNGCPKCNQSKAFKNKRKTAEQFIQEARQIHGDKYDYSKVDYQGTHKKVCIICPEHGEFYQAAIEHLKGSGCPKCSCIKVHLGQTKTTEQFIEECKKIWGDRYSYERTIYAGCLNKVIITCPIHGDFKISASDFIHGHGCQECGGTKKLTTESFINKAKQIHNDEYDYSKVKYINSKKKVCIICPKHGEFWQTPSRHLSGDRCPKCFKSYKKTTEQFIEDAKKIHGNKYDYSKVDYQGTHKKVCIICPEHGEFQQKALSHLQGQGCPKCKQSHLERETEILLKELHLNYEYEKNFKWLGSKKLDFYLPDYNIAIECQGEQHFRPVESYGGIKAFKKQVKRDIAKYNECKENNTKLLYIINEEFNNSNSKVFSGIYSKLYFLNEIKKYLLLQI